MGSLHCVVRVRFEQVPGVRAAKWRKQDAVSIRKHDRRASLIIFVVDKQID